MTAVGACGGPNVPLRGGRIDATKAGPLGVPLPESDIETTLHEMSSSGFDQSDAIALTACGHTFGGVHQSSFPNVGKFCDFSSMFKRKCEESGVAKKMSSLGGRV